jgi:hypothetical protein
VVSRA